MAKIDYVKKRRQRLVKVLAREKLDALLVTNFNNVRYLTGFRGDDSALLIGREGATLITDSRFVEQAGMEAKGVGIHARKGGLLRTAGKLARKMGGPVLGVESASMTLAGYEDLEGFAGKVELRKTRNLIEALRAVKDASEIALIRQSTRIAEEAFRQVTTSLRPGMTEVEIAHALEQKMEELGAEAPAFPTIVAVGERSSMPHAIPGGRKLKRGEAILFDWGARFNLYHSDLTRVVFLSRIPPPFERLYPLVLEAQSRAIRRIGPGRTTGAVDAAAREYLKSRRHGKHFGHGLGHGVGLEIHEAPSFAPKQKAKLKAGMVVTVEPGVYLPGKGGVRIEDMVLITRQGCEKLSSIPNKPMETMVVG